jgi:predicted metallo-beta-lactamase superfamily hydrolase
VYCRELIENTTAQKHQKLSSSEHLLITELLVAKDNELKETLKLATEQAKINHKMEALKGEVERQDQYIQQLQRQLKEAEQILVSEYYYSMVFWSSHYCDLEDKMDNPSDLIKGKAVLLHAMEVLGGRGGIAPTHSRPRH